MQQAMEYASVHSFTDVSATGHSLGGSMAQLLATQYGIPAETFNAYGTYDLALGMGLDPDAAAGLVINNRDVFDPVSALSKQIGSDKMYMSETEYDSFRTGPLMGGMTGFQMLGAHSISNFWNADTKRPGDLFTHNYWDDAQALGDQIADRISDELHSAMGGIVKSFAGLSNLFSSMLDDIEGLAKLINSDDTYRIVRYDPLALDLNGDGVIGTNKESDYQGALFDEDGDGIKTATGWTATEDGLLCRDLNDNGIIDSGAELFGEQTVLADGTKAANGFAALVAL